MRGFLFLAMIVVSVAGCSNEPVASPPATLDDVYFEVESNALHSALLEAKFQCSLALATTSTDKNEVYARILMTCGWHANRLFKWADLYATPHKTRGIAENENHLSIYRSLADIAKQRVLMYQEAYSCVWPREMAAKNVGACLSDVHEKYKENGGLY